MSVLWSRVLQTFHSYGVRKHRHRAVLVTYRYPSLRPPVALTLVAFIALLLFNCLHLEPAASASLTGQKGDKLKDPQFIAEGATLFAPVCGNAYCHGAGGKGGGAPRLRGKGLESPYLFKTISNGIPGTAMLSFKSEFSDEQIWKLVAFIMSDSATTPAASAEAPAADKPAASTAQPKPAESDAALSTVGSVQAGKALFFDSSQPKSCHSCHSLRSEGTPIGPDLSKLAARTPRELLLSIVLARETKDPRFATVTLTLRNGDKIVGVKKEEDADSIRVYDATELPAVLRTIQKTDIAKLETSNESVMPKDYASIYTVKQLLDLVTFLKSSESRVTLKELFQ
jgi:putative heme-binding domain-containing protein